MRKDIERNFMVEADMVFTTLSGTGRRMFAAADDVKFGTVLIDEAAQAHEVAVLQPLTFGAER